MRVIISVKSRGGSSGASCVTRYISERDRDPEREGKEPRKLFSDREDEMTYRLADRVLSGSGMPDKEDVLHLAVSFQPGDYERLGETDEERKKELREIAREAMREIARDLQAEALSWVAGIHLNTPHPHLHLVLNKEYQNSETGKTERLSSLPRKLLPHREKGGDGQEQVVPGPLVNRFEEALARRIERIRELKTEQHLHTNSGPQIKRQAPEEETILSSHPARDSAPETKTNEINTLNSVTIGHQPATQDRTLVAAEKGSERTNPKAITHAQEQEVRLLQERTILGRAMVAEDEIERLSQSVESALAYGELRRFQVTDRNGSRRYLSEFDLRRRASARSTRALAGHPETVNSEEQIGLRQRLFDEALGREEETLKEVRSARMSSLIGLTRRLERAKATETPIIEKAAAIKERYAAEGKALPTPILKRSELTRLQEQAITLGNFERVSQLEEIRLELAQERGEETRNEREMGRLQAHLFVARLNLQASRQRESEFEQTRDFQRWEIGGRKWSMLDVSREIDRQRENAKVVDKNFNFHLWKSGREAAANRTAELEQVREKIKVRLTDKRAKWQTETERGVQVASTLENIYEREVAHYRRSGREIPPPIFSQEDLRRIEGHALQTRDPELLKVLSRLENQYNLRTPEERKTPVETRAARAFGREIMTEIEARETSAQLDHFNARRNWIAVLVEDRKQGGSVTKTLHELEPPRTEIGLLIRPFITRTPSYRQVAMALDERGAYLAEAHERSLRFHQAARTVAEDYRREFHSIHPGRELPRPEFTPKEITELEVRAERETDPRLRDYYQALHLEATRSEPHDAHDAPSRTNEPMNRSEIVEERRATQASPPREALIDFER